MNRLDRIPENSPDRNAVRGGCSCAKALRFLEISLEEAVSSLALDLSNFQRRRTRIGDLDVTAITTERTIKMVRVASSAARNAYKKYGIHGILWCMDCSSRSCFPRKLQTSNETEK